MQQGDTDKPTTSKATDCKPTTKTKCEESASKSKVSDNLKLESDSETQNTSCSDESIEENKPKLPGPLENLKLLASTIDELFGVVESKA